MLGSDGKTCFQDDRGGMNSEVLRNRGGTGARSVTVVLQGEGRGHFYPKSALRNISMAPYMYFLMGVHGEI